MLILKAQKRNTGENLDKLRKEGNIPAVFYGAGQENTSVTIPLGDFIKVWREAGESSTVKIAYEDGEIDVLIHDVQTHPVSEIPLHVDFLAVDMNKKIEVGVPLEFVGISGAVKNGLGNLVKSLHEIEIEALPKDLPHNLEVDISTLEGVDDQILVSDIKLPEGVSLISNREEVVASITLQVEEVEEEVEPVDLDAIEVEKKGKKEEEGEAADAPAEEKTEE